MWKRGPLPKGTYNWGAVVVAGKEPTAGFQFADFRGDHVILMDGKSTRLNPEQVGYYDNSIEVITKPVLETLLENACA